MKRKSFLVIAALTAVGLLSGCGSTTSSSVTVDDPSTVTTTPSVDSESTVEVVHVTSISLSLDKTTLTVGEQATATVTVLPDNADDKTYELTVDNNKAEVDGLKITAKAAGKVNVTAKSTDGEKTSTVELTIEEAPIPETDPVLEVDVTALTVAAGVDITLPTATATDYDGTDLTSSIDISDYNDPKSINATTKVFNSKIAGIHSVSYYVESPVTGLFTEKLLTVNVTAASEEGYDLEGLTDPSKMTEYTEFRDNFEQGMNSPLYKSTNDSNNAMSLTATSDAIGGNSLLVDLNKTAGSAANALFINTFNSYVFRTKPATYTVSFDYKILSSVATTTDVYFGLNYDGFDGINSRITKGTEEVNTTYRASFTYSDSKFPETGNAWFQIFKLGGSAEDSIMVFDNFSFVTQQSAEFTEFVPTSDELIEGVTFDWKTKASRIDQGKITVVDSIEDETIKSTIQANPEMFGDNVMHLTGRDGHNIHSLTSTNLLADKNLEITFNYYSVNDSNLNVILMTSGGNNTINSSFETSVVEGNIKQFKFKHRLPSGTNTLNIYPTNGAFSIYMGNMTVHLTEADPIPEDQTPGGKEVGYSLTVGSRQWGNEAKNGCAMESVARPEGSSTELSESLTKLTYSAPSGKTDCVVEWFQGAGRIEANQTYSVSIKYEVQEWSAGGFFWMHDNGNFQAMPTTVGYHEFTQTYTPTGALDFVCLYTNNNATGVVLFDSMTFTLTAINK